MNMSDITISKDYFEQLLAVVLAAKGIKQREDIGGYGHEGIPDLLIALAALEEDV